MSVFARTPDAGRRIPMPLLVALIVLPVLLFYAILAILNTNLPTDDDYNGLFNFALHWQSLPDLSHRLPILLTFQHNEYRMPLVFSLVGMELQFTHNISVPLWIWTGNLLALTLLFPLWKYCAPDGTLRNRLLFFVPVAWIVMSLGYAETLDFALCGMQFVFVTALSVLALYCISRPGIAINYLGCLLALMACATYVNAFMLAPAGIGLLWFNGKRKVFAAWVLAFALGLIPFVYHYQFAKHPHPGAGATLLFLLTVLGGPFGFHGIYIGAALCGAVILALFGYLVWHRADRVAPFPFWLSVWLVLGFVLITFGRASGGPVAALVSRYKIWSDLLLASLYLQVLEFWRRGSFPRLQRSYVVTVVVACSVIFGLGSDALGWYRLHWRQVDLTYAISRYVQSNGAISPVIYPETSPDFQRRPVIEAFSREKLTGVIEQGLYRLPVIK